MTDDGEGVASDERQPFRVFLACSRELADERAGFDEAVRRLNDQPQIQRAYTIEPVRWETSTAGFDADGANRAIALEVDFPRLDVIVVAVWNKVGRWTLEEYERAGSKCLGRSEKTLYKIFLPRSDSG